MIERWATVAECKYEAHVHVCATKGCGALAFGDEQCARCREEIDALRAMAQRRDERREARHVRLARWGAAVRKWLEVPLLIGVACAGMYLAAVYGSVFLDWLDAQ